MALKKTTDTEKAAVKKSTEKKTAVKKETAAEKAAEKKAATEKKAAAKKTAAEEKSVARKAAASKKTPDEKKLLTPRTTRKKAGSKKAEPKVNVVIEYAGKQVSTDEVVASITEAYEAENPDTAVETVEVYIQPEKNVAYYVVNGESGKNTKVCI